MNASTENELISPRWLSLCDFYVFSREIQECQIGSSRSDGWTAGFHRQLGSILELRCIAFLQKKKYEEPPIFLLVQK